jgi:ribose transport system substrate-binding protein
MVEEIWVHLFGKKTFSSQKFINRNPGLMLETILQIPKGRITMAMVRSVSGGRLAALTLMLSMCGAAGGHSADAATGANALDPAKLIPPKIVGSGPFGEAPSTADSVRLTADEEAAAKAAHFKVGVVMQTMDIDWSKLVVQGITDTLKKYDAQLVGVTNANFQVDTQVAQIGDMIQLHPQAIISIPVDNTATAEAYKSIGKAGIKLILMHQVPQGLKYPQDYQAVISPDNQGNGQVAAEMLAHYIAKGGTVGIVNFGVDFFTTNERTKRVKEWLKENRPDIKIKQVDFIDTTKVGDVAANFLTANPDVNGLFVVWDAPAMQVVSAMRDQGKDIPVTTIDLGNEAAIELAQGGIIKGIAAQQPYDQGVAEAEAALKVLLGKQAPPWIVLPAVPVLPSNVLDAYQAVFHSAPPAELTAAYKKGEAK